MLLNFFAKLTGKHLCRSLFFNKVEKRVSGSCVFLRLLWILRSFHTQRIWATASNKTWTENVKYKSSRPEVFCKKGVPKIFAKFRVTTSEHSWSISLTTTFELLRSNERKYFHKDLNEIFSDLLLNTLVGEINVQNQ